MKDCLESGKGQGKMFQNEMQSPSPGEEEKPMFWVQYVTI